MDENDAPQNRSNEDAETSKSSDENSFIGKMKFGVSKILPNSLSKWLSPKVDATTARRRRYEEVDSDDDGGPRDGNPSTDVTDSRYQTTPQLAAPPPNKKKKTFTDFLSRNTFDLYTSTATTTPIVGERSNIASSTLIEDVPHRTNNQFNRFLPLENGQHTVASTNAFGEDLARDNASNDRYNDEASSSQSREKPTNPFTINNDSSVVNFSAHLQRAKSLFTNRSYVSPRLKNYRMRNPRSSLYRSTSSLCDNNSVSSNASSAMSSPFYNGQTTFGGASAISRRMNTTTLNQDSSSLYHRPKVPTNLVTSRSTSSLNTIGSAPSTSMSTTAKRILDVMSKYNTPLSEVRRISNALPSISETSVLNKHKSILELETTTNEIDKSKRSLLKPNTPYNRPFGRNPVESVLTTELHVPSMPELLQLKRFATNTMKIRDIANQSDSILNKPIPRAAAVATTNAFKFTETVSNRDGDIDASNNNKFVNNKNDAISISANDTNKEHKNKIRSNLTKRKMGKCTGDDAMPEPVNLPNIPLVTGKKADIKFSEPFKLQNTDKKTTGTTDNGLQIQFNFKSSNTNSLDTSAPKEKRTNGNDTEITKRFEINPSKPTLSTPATSFNARTTSSTIGEFSCKPAQPAINNTRPSSTYRFTEPIIIKSTSNSFQLHNKPGKSAYKFSEPTFVTDKPDETPKSLANFKFDPKPIKGVTSDSGIEMTQSFGSNSNKSTGLFASKPSFGASTDNGFSVGKTVSSVSTQLQDDDLFKSLVAKQKQGKWECKDCLASNEMSASKCLACGGAKSANVPVKSSKSQPAAAVDDVFKSLAAKQKQGKWECKDCLASNEMSASKCLACGGAKSADIPVKSSQSQPSAAVDDVFKSIVAKQKQLKWECKDCLASNNQADSKCGCCGGSNPNASSNSVTDSKAAPPKATFNFGALPSSTTGATSAATSKSADNLFKSIVEKQKSSWECSACLSANDMSKSKCQCCEQSRDVTKGATTSPAVPAKPQFSFGSGAVSTVPKSTFSFGSIPGTTTSAATTVSATPTFSFGTGTTKSTPSAQFSFGNLKKPETTSATSSNGKTEDDKAKEPVQKTPVSAQFSFGVPTALPSTSKIETTPKPAAPVANDDIFKSIVNEQKASSWECSSCLTKNSNDTEKCACCETSKDGSAPKDSSKKEFGSLASSQKFSFGSPSGSTFNFGSKPETKPSFQFGSAATATASSSTTATASTTVTSTTSSTFGSSSQTSTFTFKTSTSESTAPSQSAALAGFKFGFGSSSLTNAPIFGSKEVSKDETDTGTSSKTNSDKGITVLENVVVKPATNGPTEVPKPVFSFGQGLTTPTSTSTADETVTKAKKRSNTDQADDNILTKFPATTSTSSAPFVFKQPQNTFSAIASTPTTTNVTQESSTAPAAQKPPTFAFGMSKQPTFGNVNSAVTPFSFTTGNTATTTASNPFDAPAAAPALNTPSQPVFGSNAFSTATSALPTLGGFKAGPTFGSSAPAFGTTSPNTEAQQQATPSPGLFQFGASGTTTSTPLSSEPPKIGGFNFSMNTPPTFNFTEQAPQQPNVPFQFGAASDVPNIFSTQPSANATAIQQRRKLRPVRRVNRP